MSNKIFPEISELIEKGNLKDLKNYIEVLQPPDIADVAKNFSCEEQKVFFDVLPIRIASKTFEYLGVDTQMQLLDYLSKEKKAEILNAMAPDDRTTLYEQIESPEQRKEFLCLLSENEQKITLFLLGYPKGSIGRLMTPDFIAIKKDWTVKEVLDFVRNNGHDSETLNVLYVTNERDILIDDIRMREFLLAPLDKKVSAMMDNKFLFLRPNHDINEAVQLFRNYNRTALPVINDEGHLYGIVTIDDILNVSQQESTKEMQNLGGSEALDEPYMATPLFEMVRKRAGWLIILFLGELLTATAMGYFEEEISKAVVLALFVPLIISSGGNSGSQATSLIIRAIALREVKLTDWFKIMKREVFSGILLGTILGAIGFIRISVWSLFSNIYGPHWILIALTVGLSLVFVVLWGSLAGSMLPLLLRKFKFDPAKSSAPFVATLVDVTGLIIYFMVAFVFLKGTLL